MPRFSPRLQAQPLLNSAIFRKFSQTWLVEMAMTPSQHLDLNFTTNLTYNFSVNGGDTEESLERGRISVCWNRV